MAGDGDGHVPERAQRHRAVPGRRRAPRVGGQPRQHRLQPVAVAAAATSSTPTSCASTSTRSPTCRSRSARRWRWSSRTSSTSTASSAGPRRAARAASTSTSGSRPSGASSRCAARARAGAGGRAPHAGRATSKWWKEERVGVFLDYNQNAPRPHDRQRLQRPRGRRRARLLRPVLGGGPGRRAGRPAARHRPRAARDDRRPDRRHRRPPCRLDALLDLARRDEEQGIGDAPWPPNFPKMPGEPPASSPRGRRSRRRLTRGRSTGDVRRSVRPRAAKGGLHLGKRKDSLRRPRGSAGGRVPPSP